MKGREAVRTARRRQHEAQAAHDELSRELQAEQHLHRRDVQVLQAEIRRLHTEHELEAGVIAERELKRLLAKAEEERRSRGLSDDIVMHFANQKDRLIMNACRYLSMTKGEPPEIVFPTVMAWCTDSDYFGTTKPAELFIKIGVPADGWVARMLNHGKWRYYERYFARRDRRNHSPAAISLDHAEQQGHPEIHPKYRPHWYPKVIHEGIELVEDSNEAAT